MSKADVLRDTQLLDERSGASTAAHSLSTKEGSVTSASGDFYGLYQRGGSKYYTDREGYIDRVANEGGDTYWSFGVDSNGDGVIDTHTLAATGGTVNDIGGGAIDVYGGLLTLSYDYKSGAWSVTVNSDTGLLSDGLIDTDIEVRAYITEKNKGDYIENPGSINVQVTCFTPDTLIQCPEGERSIERLEIGDLVTTADGQAQRIKWIGRATLDADDLAAMPDLRPVRIEKDSLGPGIPSQMLTVSPQHRILLRSKIAERMFGAQEILVPAKKLIDHPGISVDENCNSVEYIHLLLEEHELLISNGAVSESLLWGREVDKGLWQSSIDEAFSLFPKLADEAFAMVPARLCVVGGKQIRKLIERHQANNRPLWHAAA